MKNPVIAEQTSFKAVSVGIPLPMMHIPLVFITNIVLRPSCFFLKLGLSEAQKKLHQKGENR